MPDALAQAVHRSVEKGPDGRVASATELRRALIRVRQALERGTELAPAPRHAPAATIAVQPLVDRSRDAEDEYFSDGFADELLNVLTRVRGVRVVARTSAFQFKGTTDDIASIGRKLNVATVLQGSVRKAGHRIRVSVQLVQLSDGFHLWSETYGCLLDDIFAVQDDIARSVMRELRSALVHEATDSTLHSEVQAEVTNASKGRSTSPEAHRLYLLGSRLMGVGTREGKVKAFGTLKEAIRLDSNRAQTWCELSSCYHWPASLELLPMAEAYPFACEAEQRAITLEPDSAAAHNVLGLHRLTCYRDRNGATSVQRGLALAPGNQSVVRAAAVSARVAGRFDEALVLRRRGVECEPLSALAYHETAEPYCRLLDSRRRKGRCERRWT